MRKLGLVGGMSWVSTMDYYRFINEGINARLGGLHFAECLIYSVDFDAFLRYNTTSDWDAAFELLLGACDSLRRGGAEGIVLCANTAHATADRLEPRIGLPLIHIASVTAAAINAQGLKRVGLLGTKFTMELDFYFKKLKSHGIEAFVPAAQETRDYIQYTLREELARNIVRPETKQIYLEIIASLITEGAEGIVLGCTEIPMLISQADVPVPVFDTTRIHAAAAVEFAVG